VAALTLWANARELPADLRASAPITLMTAVAGVFFAVFAALYVVGFAK
jgi:hypothetical protein